jgi:radical SAM superfamily enzyme YgiQ (UPF0313 family)
VADIVLVNPRFNVSYWGLEHALPIFGKKANVPTACLPLLAALTPPEHQVTLIEEDVEPLDFDRLARADIVGLTGMSVQRQRMREILSELKQRGIFTVVGGPWVTVCEGYFDGLADAIFVGEAEETWPRFLREWQAGKHQRRYEQGQPTDMSRVPVPRFDLLDMKHYVFGSVQFSRGCPFQCEFCDIVVTFGRRPRLKTSAQILAELDALRATGLRMAFLVDDNLIGNKTAVKAILADVAAWQRRHGYPLSFFTQASLDLAEEPELLRLMEEANIGVVFVGVESPNEESLRETGKLQNVRGGPLAERVRAIQRAGLEVWCGMILGFDHDDESVFAAHRRFLRDSRIMHSMIGMLGAIPKTPLYARLTAEGRLDSADESPYGTNVVPRLMSREALRDGYVKLMQQVYSPDAYFGCFDDLYLTDHFRPNAGRTRYWADHRWQRAKVWALHIVQSAGLFWRLMRAVKDRSLRREYRRRVLHLLCRRPDPVVLFILLLKCATHYHYHKMSLAMAQGETAVVNSL